MNYSEIIDLFIDNLKKFVFPEEWLDIDLSFSKQEIFTILIVERHGEIIMSQIASYVNIPMSTATGIVDRLVKNGYLIRERSDSDRRIVVIKLSQKGKELIDCLKQKGNEYIQMINEGLTDEERESIFKIFLKIMDIISNKRQEIDKGTEKDNEIKRIEIE